MKDDEKGKVRERKRNEGDGLVKEEEKKREKRRC